MNRKLRLLVAFAVMIPAGASISTPSSMAAPSAFPQGVAGYGGATDAILWTRHPSGGRVHYRVSTTREFRRIVAEGTMRARAANDYTIKPSVSGLRPGLTYFYQFGSRRGLSPIAKFQTLRGPNSQRGFDFAISGDSDKLWTDWPDDPPGQMAVLARVRETNPAFFIYLGDTIYSDSETGAEPALTLQEKWAKYRANRVRAAKRMLSSVSVWAGWDDHEVINDYDGAVLAQTDPALLEAGQKAFFDYWPVREEPTYRSTRVGANAEFFVLDERTYRTQSPDEEDSPCRLEDGSLDLAPTMPPGDRQALNLPPASPACLAHMFDPTRTMLGAEQKAWLLDGLSNSTARWKFIVNQVPITEAYAVPYDRWEGYHAERDEILRYIRDNEIENVVFLTTDIHANAGTRVYVDKQTDEVPVAYEIIAGPIQTCTLDCELANVVGPGQGENFVTFMRFRGLIDADCMDINTYAYAHVTMPDDASRLSVQWRTGERARNGGGTLIEGCDETIVAAPDVTP
ncbi:MAG: alkaline phosphatase D family protein [Actinomycetota bacterium]